MATSVVRNAVIATVVFEDANGTATAPDGSVVWTVYDQSQTSLDTETQALGDATATGTYQFTYTPTSVETIYIEASATVQSIPQVARVAHTVKWA